MRAIPLLWIMAVHLGLNLVGMHGLPALLPRFMEVWALSASEAGLLAGMPALSSIFAILITIGSDRFDARRLVIAGSLANAVGFLGFGLLADGFWSALVFRAVQGIGFAWIYLPGAKVIADRSDPRSAPRATALYISTFPIVASLSFVLIAWISALAGWRIAFCFPGITAIVAALLVLLLVEPRPVKPGSGRSLDLVPVFANRAAIRLVFANFCHTIELLAVRGWMVAFFVFAATISPGAPGWDWPLLATLLTLLGAPMSMIGSWLGERTGMARISAISLVLSGGAGCLLGFAADWPFWLLFLGPILVQNMFILMDSGTLAGGVVETTDPEQRGRALALHAFANAVGSFVGPVLFGIVLEASGGTTSVNAWGIAFLSIGLIAFLGAIAAAGAASRRRT